MDNKQFATLDIFKHLRMKANAVWLLEQVNALPVSLSVTDLIHMKSAVAGQFGNTYYVDSVNGSDGYKGSKTRPKATINAGISLMSARDTLILAPGHQEDIIAAAAIDINVSSIRIIGVGHGSQQPQVTFTHVDGTVAVTSANNIYVENVRFSSSLDSVPIGVDVLAGSTDVWFNGCRWDVELAATDEFDLCVRFAAGCDRPKVTNCEFDMDLANAVMAIQIIDVDAPVIKGNKIRGDYSTANIGGLTTLSTNVDIGGNTLVNGEGGALNSEPVIELITGSTGEIYDNYCVCNLATKSAAIVSATSLLFENYYNEDISGAATGGIIGTPSADD